MEHMHTDHEYTPNMKMSSQQSVDSSAPSDTSSRIANGAGLFAMAYPHNLSSSSIAGSSSSWTHDSLVTLFPQQRGLDSERDSQPLIGCYYLHNASPSHDRLCADRKMTVHESQSMASEVQLVQNQTSKILSGKGHGGDVIRSAKYKCDYYGCNKAFDVNKRLKRHKQTYVGYVVGELCNLTLTHHQCPRRRV